MHELDQQVKAALAHQGKILLRLDVDHAYRNYTSKQRTKMRVIYQVAAAAVIVMIFGATLFVGNNTARTPERLFASYYEIPSAKVERGNSVNHLVYQNALIAYNRQDYASAIPLLQQCIKDASMKQQDGAWYYLGHAYMAQKQLTLAVDALKKVHPNSLLYPDARWDMALAALANHQKAQSTDILKSIAADDTHHKQRTAQDLLKQLGK